MHGHRIMNWKRVCRDWAEPEVVVSGGAYVKHFIYAHDDISPYGQSS